MTSYIKKPIPVQVEFATSAGNLPTLEGRVAYESGDALVTGVAGERWPIRRERFERTYRACDAGGAMGRNGRFMRQPALVQARQTENPVRIPLEGNLGILLAKAGDWIVTGPDGETWPVANGIFQESYEPADAAEYSE